MPNNNTVPSASRPKPSKLSRALKPGSIFEKDEASDVAHWLRQIVSFMFGIIWGIIPMTGLFGFSSFIISSLGIMFLYVTQFIKLEGVNDFEEQMPLVTDGMMPGIATFMLSWIITYTLVHF
eukprot:gb/GECH01001604.1/.p1 GENE.gb/GECH01001604.1/~~gb/GECH01001604.1/.p1  ORF type:complete len:122 (+),score=25.61 gb/GECH01001604.1/:1-366(+)